MTTNIMRFQIGMIVATTVINLRMILQLRKYWNVYPDYCKDHYVAIVSLSFLLSIMTLLYIFEARRNKNAGKCD